MIPTVCKLWVGFFWSPTSLIRTPPDPSILNPYPTGMGTLVIKSTVNAAPNTPATVRQVELSLRKAGTNGPFLPVAMDHLRNSNNRFELGVTPLSLPSDHDNSPDVLPLQDTFYEVRVRASGPFGDAIWAQSDPNDTSTQLVVRVEEIPASDSGWDLSQGASYDALNDVLKIPAGISTTREFEFPGWTDWVIYDMVIRVRSKTGTGQLQVTCPDVMNVNVTKSNIGTSFIDWNLANEAQGTIAPPRDRFKETLVLTNTGTKTLLVSSVKRARRPQP